MAVWNVIDHTELSGTASYYEKTSIVSGYDHLYFVASLRTDASAYYDFCHFQFNGDTTDSNYFSQFTNSETATPASNSGAYSWGAQVPAASGYGDMFGICEMWIPNYANSSNEKSVFTRCVAPNRSTTDYQYNVGFAGNVWENTAAINAFKFLPYGGADDFVQYSTFTLYGINGAG